MISCRVAFNRVNGLRLSWTVLFLALICGGTTLFAQPSREPKRFLFVIDTSAAMKPFENAIRESMFDLIYSGVRGHMTNGDSYGIWLVNEQNDTSFKMETWKHRFTVEMAARAAKHVTDHGFKGKAKLGQALVDAAVVIKNVEDLKVVLISNGDTPISGTPFDDVINVRFRELAPHMKRAKATLNTTFVAQDGNIVAWAANTPEFLIEIPYVAPKPPKPKVVVPQTNSTSGAQASASSISSEPPKPRPVVSPIIITKETVAQEKRTYQSMTSTAVTEAAATNANIAAAPASPVTNVVPAAAAHVVQTNPVAVLPNASVSSAVATTIPLAATTPTVADPEPTHVAAANAVSLPITAVKGPASEMTPASISWPPMLWAAIGAAIAFGVVLTIFLLCRNRRREPSLISQSLSRERVPAS